MDEYLREACNAFADRFVDLVRSDGINFVRSVPAADGRQQYIVNFEGALDLYTDKLFDNDTWPLFLYCWGFNDPTRYLKILGTWREQSVSGHVIIPNRPRSLSEMFLMATFLRRAQRDFSTPAPMTWNFEEALDELKRFQQTRETRVVTIALMPGLRSDLTGPIPLAPGVILRPITDVDLRTIGLDTTSFPTLAVTKFVIVADEWVRLSGGNTPEAETAEAWLQTLRSMGRALRVFRPGPWAIGPFFQRAASVTDAYYYFQRHIPDQPIVPYEAVTASRKELLGFSSFWRGFISDSFPLFFDLAVDRLYMSCDRASPADAIVDLMIGFEALFSDDFSNIKKHLTDRVSRYLERLPLARQHLRGTMLRGYQIRSAVVHGEAVLSQEIDSLRDQLSLILARALRRLMSEPGFAGAGTEWRTGFLQRLDSQW